MFPLIAEKGELYFPYVDLYNINKRREKMEFKNKRCAQILNLLFRSKGKMTGDSLAVSLGVSSRTIRSDIKLLNAELENWGAKVISEIGQGYYLKIYDQNSFYEFLGTLRKKNTDFQNIIPSEPADRVHYIITKLLLLLLNGSKEYIDPFDLEEELFISTSTLKKDFRMIDQILEKYDLRISITKKNGVCIVGEEAKIRYCISEYIFNSKGYFQSEENEFYKNVFLENDMNRLKAILLDVITKYQLRLTDIAFKNLLIHTLIMLKRFAVQQSVNYEKADIESFEKRTEFKCAKEIIKRIQKEFQVDFGDEVYYLTQHLISSQRFFIDDPEDDYEYKDEIKMILETIKEETDIDLSDDKQLINGLAIHLEATLQRLRFDMNIRNEFLDSIKNMYPLAFELAVLAAKVIAKNHSLKTKENEIGFLAIHFGAALERKGLNQSRKCQKAVIVCIAGAATGLLLKEKIEQNFENRIEIVKNCPKSEVTQELIDSVDLVLTTVPLEDFKSPKIKQIHLFLKESDVENLREVLDNTRNDEGICYQDIFRKELFFADVDLKEKHQVLTYITDIMLEKGYISKDVQQSVFKREEIATTELGSLVAMPHALLNNTEEAVVAVLILRKPIVWENEKVQVVLLLNIPKDKYEIWEVVFKRLYHLLIENRGVTRLIKNRNYEDFIEHLQN